MHNSGTTCAYILRAFICLLLITSTASQIFAQESTIEIDARGAPNVVSQLNTRDVVVVRVINKNPFLFKYRTTINTVTVQDTAAFTFIGQLSPLLASLVPAGPGPSSVTPSPSLAPERDVLTPSPACEAATLDKATAALRGLDDDRARLVELERAAEEAVGNLARTYSTTKVSLDQRRQALRSPAASWAELDNAASAFIAATAQYPSAATIDSVESRLRAVQVAATELLATIADYRSSFPSCQPLQEAKNALIGDRVYAESLAGWWYGERQAIVATVRQGLEPVRATIAAINKVRGEQSYQERHHVGGFESPTVVTVVVERWPLEDADEKAKQIVAQGKLNFGGGARFLLSGGMGHVRGLRAPSFSLSEGTRETRTAISSPRSLPTWLA